MSEAAPPVTRRRARQQDRQERSDAAGSGESDALADVYEEAHLRAVGSEGGHEDRRRLRAGKGSAGEARSEAHGARSIHEARPRALLRAVRLAHARDDLE